MIFQSFSRRCLAVSCAAMLIGACGSQASSQEELSVFDQLKAQRETLSRTAGVYNSIEEAMPNFLYEIDGETGAVADLYVSGRVTQVEEGPSHSWDESGDREVRIEHPFNDPGAWTSQVRVTVEVDTAIAAPGQKTSADVELVQFGLSFPAPLDLDAVRRELMSYHRIAALYSGSAVYDHDPTLWAVMEDGAFLGIVDADGGVSFPAIEPGDEVRIEGVPFVPDDLTDLEDPEQTEPVVAVYDESADTWTRP